MGAWGTGLFENDTAADVVADIQNGGFTALRISGCGVGSEASWFEQAAGDGMSKLGLC